MMIELDAFTETGRAVYILASWAEWSTDMFTPQRARRLLSLSRHANDNTRH